MDCTQPAGPFYCYDLQSFTPATTSNNCDIDPIFTITSDLITANDCSINFITELNNCGFFPDANGTTYAMALADVGLMAYVLKIHTRTYIATDDCGNVSAPCTYKLIIEAAPDLATNVVCPSSLLLSNGTNLMCDGDYETISSGPFAGNPAPKGGFAKTFPLEGTIETTDMTNAAGNVYQDVYMFEYMPSVGTCETVTITKSSVGGGSMTLLNNAGMSIAAGGTINATLCAGERYTILFTVGVSNANIPIPFSSTDYMYSNNRNSR